MAEMGRYCKAYLASDFAKYKGWNPDLANLRQPEADRPDQEPDQRTELADDDILYLQESLAVTDGIFLDENVLFSDDSADWKRFCEGTLEFAVPEDVLAIGAEEAAEEAADDDESAEE